MGPGLPGKVIGESRAAPTIDSGVVAVLVKKDPVFGWTPFM